MLEKLSYFVNRTFKSVTDLDPIFHKFITHTIPKPVKPENKDDDGDATIFDEDIHDFVKQHNNLKVNVKTLYLFVWGQLIKSMRAKIVGLKRFKSIKDTKDSDTLLVEIDAISYE